MDHCYSTRDPPYPPDGENRLTVSAKANQVVNSNSITSDITDWFCKLLRSLYYKECSKYHNCKDFDIKITGRKHMRCKKCNKSFCAVPTGVVDVCTKITRHIHEECSAAFIDGQCLKFHEDHMNKSNIYSSQVRVNIDGDFKDLKLAYYNPGGVYLKVYALKEGEALV